MKFWRRTTNREILQAVNSLRSDVVVIGKAVDMLNVSEETVLRGITEITAGIRTLLGSDRTAVAMSFSVVILDPTKFLEGRVEHMQMKTTQQAVAHIEAVDAEGNPTSLPNPPSWESSDPSIVTVNPSPDGMSCVIGSPNPGAPGSAVVTCSADVGGKQVSGTLAVDIIAGDAAAINITTDEPTDA